MPITVWVLFGTLQTNKSSELQTITRYVSPSPVLFFFVAPPSTHVLPPQLASHFEGVKTLRLLVITQLDEENGSRLKHAGQSA